VSHRNWRLLGGIGIAPWTARRRQSGQKACPTEKVASVHVSHVLFVAGRALVVGLAFPVAVHAVFHFQMDVGHR
jgi:hypothetical protein